MDPIRPWIGAVDTPSDILKYFVDIVTDNVNANSKLTRTLGHFLDKVSKYGADRDYYVQRLVPDWQGDLHDFSYEGEKLVGLESHRITKDKITGSYYGEFNLLLQLQEDSDMICQIRLVLKPIKEFPDRPADPAYRTMGV